MKILSAALALLALLAMGPTLSAQTPLVGCEHGVCLRFPGGDPADFYQPTEGYHGPFHLDHGCAPGDARCYCTNYAGQGLDACYGGHNGTDFMLVDRFRGQLRDAPVVAAAVGEILEVVDSNYDKCRLSILDLILDPEHDGNYCGLLYDVETGTVEPRPTDNNYIIMRHFNGRYYVYTRYLHIQTGSVPSWIKDALARGETPTIQCGETIALVGSAGNSLSPHLHFDARTHGAADIYGQYYLNGERPPHIDPYCGSHSEPGRRQSMWALPMPLPAASAAPEGLPGTLCQAPYDPAQHPSLPGFCAP